MLAFVCALLAFAPAARAAMINVGSIVIDKYEPFKNGGLGGVHIQLHFAPNANFANQTHVTDVRWLQRVDSSKATGFTPNPNRPFIDPRAGQIPEADNLPFYEFTYNNAADRASGANRVANGSGRFYTDSPRVLLNRSPYTFSGETLLVGIEGDIANKKLAILGGVAWSFTFAGAVPGVTVTASNVTALADNNALRGNFNTALGLDFPGWTLIPPAQWDDQVTITGGTTTGSSIPEPSAMILSLSAIAGVLVLGRRRLAKAA